MNKPWTKYDIDKITELENQGMSIRAIARKMGWNQSNTHQWIKRNYRKVITYVSKTSGIG